jgi:hypothetical protein
MAVTTVALYLLSTLDTGSTRWESGFYMALLGAGIGMVMQILVMAVQNEAPVKEPRGRHVTVTFFRAVGGSVWRRPVRRLFAHRVGELLGGSVPTGMTPTQIAGPAAGAAGGHRRRLRRRHHPGLPLLVPLVLAGFPGDLAAA